MYFQLCTFNSDKLKTVEFRKKIWDEKLKWKNNINSLHIFAKCKGSTQNFFVFQKIYMVGIFLWSFGFSVMSASWGIKFEKANHPNKHMHEQKNRWDEERSLVTIIWNIKNKCWANVFHLRRILWGFGALRNTPNKK